MLNTVSVNCDYFVGAHNLVNRDLPDSPRLSETGKIELCSGLQSVNKNLVFFVATENFYLIVLLQFF